MMRHSFKYLAGSFFLFILMGCDNSANVPYLQSDEVNIHYLDTGSDGHPIVLLHGYSMSLDMWYETGIAQELQKEYRVISLDLRGHGKSDKPESPSDYGPKMGEDVINLLDHLEIEDAHMIGYSMGAFIVGRLLVTHPSRVTSATMASGSFPVANKDEYEFQEETAKHMEEEGDIALASVARGWALDAVTEQQISNVKIPIQAVFGSEEAGEFFDLQKRLLEMPASSRPILVIDGADHDSEEAAVLHPMFLEAVKKLLSSAGDV